MSFIRPEARDALWRWREVLIATLLAFLALSWITGPGGLLGWLGWMVLIIAIALAVVGFQRARFRQNDAGPGVINLDEGRITYFGPLSGGAVDTRDMERLVLDPSATPAHWVLSQPGQPPLFIPVNAAGSEGLFDAFATLPGLKIERMLGQMKQNPAHPVVIWERKPMRDPNERLH
ncbi:MAG: hypothetical protein AB3N13_09395 [Arenibacterium sp.]